MAETLHIQATIFLTLTMHAFKRFFELDQKVRGQKAKQHNFVKKLPNLSNISSFKWLYKRAKRHPNGVKRPFFFFRKSYKNFPAAAVGPWWPIAACRGL